MYPQAQTVLGERLAGPTAPPPSGLSQSIGSLNERLLMLENTLVIVINAIEPIPSGKDKQGSPPAGLVSGVMNAHDTVNRLENIAQSLCNLVGVAR